MVISDCTDDETTYKMLENDGKFSSKNRYSDMLPFKHSRVKLAPRSSCSSGRDPDVDAYINANFIDSPLSENDGRIIATMGPLESTYVDFWRMVADQNISLIVSTCNLVEKGR